MVSVPMPRSRRAALQRSCSRNGSSSTHPVAAGERRPERLVARHVGDLPVEQVPADARRHRGHQPGPDHRTVGLVEERRHRRRRRRPGRPRRSASPGRRGRSRWPAVRRSASRGDHSAASLTSPWSLTHSASTPSGTSECGMPGRDLDARATGQQRLDERPGRRPVVGVEAAAPAAPPRRVGVGRAERARRRGWWRRRRSRHRRDRGRRGWRAPSRPGAGRGRCRPWSDRRVRRRPGRRRCRRSGRSRSGRRPRAAPRGGWRPARGWPARGPRG